MIPNDAGVAAPCRQRWSTDQRDVRRKGPIQVSALDAEQLLRATLRSHQAARSAQTRRAAKVENVPELGSNYTKPRQPPCLRTVEVARLERCSNTVVQCQAHLESGEPCHKPLTEPQMQIYLDAEKCQGHNRCYALATLSSLTSMTTVKPY